MAEKIVARAFAVGRKVYKPGMRVAADDLVVEGRERFFEGGVEVVETATANPGEQRQTPPRQTAKKPAAKKPAAKKPAAKKPAAKKDS